MDRRKYLATAGATGLVAAAGCLDVLGRGGDTVLGEPSDSRGDPSHPIHGTELPSFAVPDPIRDEQITDERFRDERSIVATFIFTKCPDGACPALLQRLVHVRAAVHEAGHEDDVAFLVFTFDPERDTADVLADHAEAFGIDPTADDWFFLRPETPDRAEQVVLEDFGLPIERVDLDEDDHDHDDGASHDHGDEDDAHDDGTAPGGLESPNVDDLEYTFTHFNLILLANEQGVVERAYPSATSVSVSDIEADTLEVLEG
ncbi:SCO family protein [Halovivax gelatinilyticus]|uniref:SCO family protein n=1 Tax=Halovivax gelatinilyticus TaxID=2961597 RepID=UPI0020CA3E10|nr:SCO family protein [Halovivax gelatinilyticus]